MQTSKQTIRIKTNKFSADGLNLSGETERSKAMIKYGLYGLVGGIGYSLLTRSSVLFGMFIGTLVGTLAGAVLNK